MIYRAIVKGKPIELDGDVTLPEGTRMNLMPEETARVNIPELSLTLKAWLQEARPIRSQLPKTSDSVEILRQLREERANR
jgi:hypothetical protein